MAVLADSFGFLHQNIGKQLRPSHITLLVLSSSTGLTLQFYDQYYTLNSSSRRGDIYTLTNATVENFHISNPCKYISSSEIKTISHIPYVVLSPPSNQPNQSSIMLSTWIQNNVYFRILHDSLHNILS